MFHSSQLNDSSVVVEAMFSTDLPGTVNATDLPNEIQWMPPGLHTINATRGGKPAKLDVNVSEAGALRVAAKHSEYMASANRGVGDAVYCDFNHDDKEASAHPVAFRWAGDDPQQGGIRARVEWTGAGKRAVLGRDFSRFSPSFYVDDNTGEITGMPVNCGGLVNRAAFQRIAPIMSKRSEAAALTLAPDFISKAKVLAKSRNLEIGDAYDLLARREPYLYECYRHTVLGLGTPPVARQESAYEARARAAWSDEFMIRANALADALVIDVETAATNLARSQPALYERYCARLGLGDGRDYAERVTAVQTRAEESEFFVMSKRIAAERSIDVTEAFSIVAMQRPDLYDQYHASL